MGFLEDTMNLRLNSLQNTRKTLARLLREFNAGKIDEGRYKGLIYGLSILLQFWKAEQAAELEARLEAIELFISEVSK